MKIINFLNSAFGISKDTAATILVTIFTFTTGIILTVLFKSFEAYLIRRDDRNLLKINLLNLIKSLFKQASGYEILVNHLIIEHIGDFNFPQKSISAIKIFDHLGYRRLHAAMFNGLENIRYFNNRKKRMAFNDLWTTIEFLTTFHQESFKLSKEFTELNMRFNGLRNKSLGEANKIIETIRLTFDQETVPIDLGKYYETIEKIIAKLRATENYTNPKIMNDLYVQPLLELNRNNVSVIKKYAQYLNPIQLNAHLLDCEAAYNNQKNLINAFNKNFSALNVTYTDNYRSMKKAYKSLFR